MGLEKRLLLYRLLLIATIVVTVAFLYWHTRVLNARWREETTQAEVALPPASTPLDGSADSIQLIREEPPLSLIMVLDQSGSMKTTDPKGLRVEAVRYLTENLAMKSAARNPHHLGLIEFGTKSEVTASLTPLKEGSRPPSVDKLTARDLGDTNFEGALRAAATELDSRKGEKRKVVLFTDGLPDDSRHLPASTYFQALRDAFATDLKSLDLYVVGLDATGKQFAPSQGEWERIAGKGHVFVLSNADELKQQFNTIVRKIFDLPETSPAVLSKPGGEVTQDIPPYLARVEFHVFPESDDWDVEVVGPDGHTVRASKQEGAGYAILRVDSPAAGTWRYHFKSGRGRIEVYRNDIPFRLALVQPADPVYPQCKPLWLALGVRRDDGRTLKSDPANPLLLSALVTDPKGKQTKVKFGDPDPAGIVRADAAVATDEAGPYTIKLTLQGGTKFFFYQTHAFQVAPLPYLVLTSPDTTSAVDTGMSLPVKCVLYKGKQEAPANEAFQDHPDTLVFAQLKAPSESATYPLPLLKGSSGIFGADLPVSVARPGQYVLAVRMRGLPTGSGSRQSEQVDSVAFRAEISQASVGASRKRYWSGIALGAGGALIAVVAMGQLWYLLFFFVLIPREKMAGTLRIEDRVTKAATTHTLGVPPALVGSPARGKLIATLERTKRPGRDVAVVFPGRRRLVLWPTGDVVKPGGAVRSVGPYKVSLT